MSSKGGRCSRWQIRPSLTSSREPGEHGGAELLAGAVGGLAVGCLAVGVAATGGESDGQLQDLLPLGEVGVEIGETILGGGEVGADAGLLDLQGGDVDGAAVVGVEQRAPFGLGLGDPAGEQLALGGRPHIGARSPRRRVLRAGVGTSEEFAEVLTWFQLGLQAKPSG